MKSLNKTPVKKRPFRGVRKRIAKKAREFDPYWYEHGPLKIGDIVFDHPEFKFEIKSIKTEWDKSRRIKKLRSKWIVIAFTDASYPCGCCPLTFVK
jgi:hypothetical protein